MRRNRGFFLDFSCFRFFLSRNFNPKSFRIGYNLLDMDFGI